MAELEIDLPELPFEIIAVDGVVTPHDGRHLNINKFTVVGNPFEVGADGGKAVVREKYRAWLWKKLKAGNNPVSDYLERMVRCVKSHGGKIYLDSLAEPEAVHAEPLKQCIDWLAPQYRLTSVRHGFDLMG